MGMPGVVVQNMPRSRAALSLLGYSYYQVNNFAEAATMCVPMLPSCSASLSTE
jgi:hypothetical protein